MNWRLKALCAQVDADLFFPPIGGTPRLAKSACPVIEECLREAMADPSLMGVWGGTTDRDRKELRRSTPQRKRDRSVMVAT